MTQDYNAKSRFAPRAPDTATVHLSLLRVRIFVPVVWKDYDMCKKTPRKKKVVPQGQREWDEVARKTFSLDLFLFSKWTKIKATLILELSELKQLWQCQKSMVTFFFGQMRCNQIRIWTQGFRNWYNLIGRPSGSCNFFEINQGLWFWHILIFLSIHQFEHLPGASEL